MPWTERQHRMLEAMGLKLWSAPAIEQPAAADRPGPEPAPPIDTDVARAHIVAAPLNASPHPRPETGRNPRPAEPIRRPGGPGIDPPDPAPMAAREAAIAAMDWTELRSAVAACRACALCETRQQTVFGVGHPRAHWMIVGEAPGENEDLQGEPFVGAAGRLLDNMLRALDLSRAVADPAATDDAAAAARQVFIANALKCRPPRNRNPLPDEMARCEPFLKRQIALVQPRIILAMGRFAVQSLLRSDRAIGQLRGQVHDYQGVPLIVTYHPAYLLRNLVDKAKAWEDLCLAASVAERG